MPKKPSGKSTDETEFRVLTPAEYPAHITAPQGAFTPDVQFAAVTPLGLYHVDHQGAGHLATYFTAKRKGSRTKGIGGAKDLKGALRRILSHVDETLHPEAPREQGQQGPVSIWRIGERLEPNKTPSQLEREIQAIVDQY